MQLLATLLLRVLDLARLASRDEHAEESGRADLNQWARLALDDLISDPKGLVDRDREAYILRRVAEAARRGGGIHPDDPALGVSQRAARVALHDAGVRLQHAVQRLLVRRAAVARRDGSVRAGDRAGDWREAACAIGIADRD